MEANPPRPAISQMRLSSCHAGKKPIASRPRKAKAAMNGSLLRIALVDQQRVFVDALVYCLKTESDIEVVCSADGTEDALSILRDRRPNLVILDADLPRGRAFDV